MNTSLNINIKNAIKSAVSGTTDLVYYLILPDKKLLDRFTVVYTINNDSNTNTFDNREIGKTYSLEIQCNCRDIEQFGTTAELIKAKIYALVGTACKYITLENEDIVYDDDLRIYKEYLRFTLTL